MANRMPDLSAGTCVTDGDPRSNFPHNDVEERRARAKCRNCLVWEQCRKWALDQRELAGMWGGLTEKEREAILGGDAVEELADEMVGASA